MPDIEAGFENAARLEAPKFAASLE